MLRRGTAMPLGGAMPGGRQRRSSRPAIKMLRPRYPCRLVAPRRLRRIGLVASDLALALRMRRARRACSPTSVSTRSSALCKPSGARGLDCDVLLSPMAYGRGECACVRSPELAHRGRGAGARCLAPHRATAWRASTFFGTLERADNYAK